jgi:hypothetical protein
MTDRRTEQSVLLMTGFAERTGLAGAGPPRRYLWTDAFAVCNFLGLARATGDRRLDELALQLVDRVHHALGRHRPDDARSGWLSGLGAEGGEAHPTRAGLRIGKPLPERAPGAPPDPRLEWDRDGQYFHYLTKWMHALDQVSRATGQPIFHAWARELAAAAHRGFTVPPAGREPPRMHWKMSIDLSRPQVASMGQHDPLDGLVACLQLDATAQALGPGAAGPHLARAAEEFAAMIDRDALATADPLGLGGLLADACRIAQLLRAGAATAAGELLACLLEAALLGLSAFAGRSELDWPAGRRVAFRELGLAIGLAALDRIAEQGGPPRGSRAARALDGLSSHAPLRGHIESFWLRPEHRQAPSWIEHQDINDVMLATSLAPDGFLVLRPPSPPSGRATS